MKLLSVGKNLYGVTSVAIAVPLFRKVAQDQGAHGDGEEGVNSFVGASTTTWMLTVPWVNVQKIPNDPLTSPEFFLVEE